MDGRKQTSEGAGDYIWLRYATNVTIAGRNHTIEMGIPMPIGADEETREQLLREADAGMNQLAGHVENRVAQMLQRVQPTQGAIPAPTPSARPSVTPPPKAVSRPAPTSASPAVSAQSNSHYTGQHSIAQSGPAPVVREERDMAQAQQPAPQNEALTVPHTRTTIGVSMPTTGDVSGNLSIPQFIRVVKDRFDLNPTQAMELLKLKSLSGVNLRDKLEQLQRIVEKDSGGNTSASISANAPANTAINTPTKGGSTGTTDPKLKSVDTTKSGEKPSKPESKQAPSTGMAGSPMPTPPKMPTPPRPSASASTKPPIAQERQIVREEHPPYGFVEEDLDEDVLDDGEEVFDDDLDVPRELTPQERVQAKDLVDKFRESQGASSASPARLKVLSNVVGDQMTDEQLQELIEGIWGIPSVKKLKVDQVEALISWAKEDDFLSDVDVVLALLEEEALARGNR